MYLPLVPDHRTVQIVFYSWQAVQPVVFVDPLFPAVKIYYYKVQVLPKSSLP